MDIGKRNLRMTSHHKAGDLKTSRRVETQDATMRYEVAFLPDVQKLINNYAYNLDSCVGQGQFSKVYLGRNVTSQQIVAIKVIEVSRVNSEIFLSLLRNEIEVLKMCDNPNLLKLYDVYNTVNNIYIVTEYCNQGELHTRIHQKGGISEEEVINIFKHLLLGLFEMQQKCIIHRDIKPSNILISNGIPKFADFGFSVCKHVPNNNSNNYNVGTPLYMAPESLLNNTYSYKSDIWALGVVLFEMLFRKTPFYSPTEEQLKVKLKQYQQHNQIPLPEKEVSRDLLKILAGMLAFDPAKRWNLQQILAQPLISPQKVNKSYNCSTPPPSTKNTTQRSIIELDVPEESAPQKPYFKITASQRKLVSPYSQLSLTPKSGAQSPKSSFYRYPPPTTSVMMDTFSRFINHVLGQTINIRIENVKLKYCLQKLYAIKVRQFVQRNQTYGDPNRYFREAKELLAVTVRQSDFIKAINLQETRFMKLYNDDFSENACINVINTNPLEFYSTFDSLISTKLIAMKGLMLLKLQKNHSTTQLQVFYEYIFKQLYQTQLMLMEHLLLVAEMLRNKGQGYQRFVQMGDDKVTWDTWQGILATFERLQFI